AAGEGGAGAGEVPWLEAMVEELRAAAGSSLVIAGEQQPAAVHAVVHAINNHLGNAGRTVTYSDPVGSGSADEIASLAELVDDMNGGAVRFLGMLDCNPVYDAPADLDFAAALDRVDTRLHVGRYVNETTVHCQWHVPQTHFLEAWGDLRAFDGTASIVQPLIEPLYGGRSLLEVVAVLRGKPEDDPYEVVRSYWQAARGAGDEDGSGAGDAAFEDFWRRSLHDGIVAGTRFEDRPVELVADWDHAPAAPAAPAAGTLELIVRPDPTVHDGRYANNGWLQELPKPITLLTWDNAALLSPATAERLGLANEDEVDLQLDGRAARAPVWIVPGHPDGAVTVHLGYGRRQTGRVGHGAGFDAYALRTTTDLWSAAAVQLAPTGGRMPLATTQHHHSMEGREPVRVGTLQDYQRTGALPGEPLERPDSGDSLYPPWKYEGDAWGMEIDLNVCMGCNGCTTACQAENNIPVVGKEQVIAGRERHWIRVDRYYADSLDDPETYFQPVPCMHCEDAPCEVVCPVGATVHGDQGLNLMVYNRCVGTRYCSNNCPYKVRRFNFLAYSDADRSPATDLMHNPDVTVRSRGVMEKCTYCLQRINEARIDANKEGRAIADGEIVPACAQACPTQAITFGNINDPDSAVSRLRAEPLHYGLLTELGTRPRTNYLARLRNPNPAIAANDEEA
ncbi:MAG: 4Fe-4S dicluster domain-containing protein, partial [Acidobacteriota bacterium]